MKKINMKDAEKKYEKSAKDKREDRKGAEKMMRDANKKKKGKY